jgi:hypothetical protein
MSRIFEVGNRSAISWARPSFSSESEPSSISGYRKNTLDVLLGTALGI